MNNVQSSWDATGDLVSTIPFDIGRFTQHVDKTACILDVGCGYGRVCRILEEMGYENLVGMDASAVLLNRASTVLKHTRLCQAEAPGLPFPIGTFDAVLTMGVASLLIDENDVRHLVDEADRVLKPNGFWFLTDYTRNCSEYFERKYEDGFREFKILRVFRSNCKFVFRHYSLAELIGYFDGCFDIVECQQELLWSMHQTRQSEGYSIVLKKVPRVSKYR